ncbi:hypothetical protein Misp01_44530 [Microtetraspora sp. NBRC 13810]|uniref:monooxygenase n=1 Tax=Microtetraspora sp. NBRC 13810 TaxID=3030990 RepID=UPI0024A52C66|nr:monooxygenase [Microtetraspora sp. NBRC 13810]GLW09324.1 hypothetical protein Misp01_44530 [Microtetraspora sp. NBRC 13810]
MTGSAGRFSALLPPVVRAVRRGWWPAALALAALLATACSPAGDTRGAPGAAPPATASGRTPQPPGTPPETTRSAPAHAGHGSPAKPPRSAPLRAGEEFRTLQPARAYTPRPPSGGTDDYRCFLVDPGLRDRMFLTGTRFTPQNTGIVHHAIFFRLGPEQVAPARALDAGTPQEGWTCFGDAGLGGATWVAHWAPGTGEALLDPAYGHELPAGSALVMQVHYNTLGAGGRPVGADRSGIRLRLSGEALRPLRTDLLTAPVELPCTARESGPLCDREAALADVARRFGPRSLGMVDYLNRLCSDGGPPRAGAVQRCDHAVYRPATVHALAGHMHLLGRSIRIELNPGTPRARTLLDVPSYDFDDQSARILDRPARIGPGDTLRVTCTHDAGLRAMLPQLSGTPPRHVVWGEGTSDEMCLGVVIASDP